MILRLTDAPSAAPGPPTSGLKLWLDAAKGVTLSGSNVSAWADQSGNGNDGSQSTSANQPTFTSASINGLPAVTFNSIAFSSATYLQGSVNVLSTDNHAQTTIAILKLTTGVKTNYNTVYATRRSGDQLALCAGSPSGGVFPGIWTNASINGATNESSAFTGPVVATPYVMEWGWDGTSTVLTSVVNGVSYAVTNSGSGPSEGPGATPGYYIGGPRTSGLNCGFQGDICEFLVYDHVLSSGDLTTVRKYLQTKYAIPLGV